jgi:hypothetical protein
MFDPRLCVDVKRDQIVPLRYGANQPAAPSPTWRWSGPASGPSFADLQRVSGRLELLPRPIR